jgi:hypothetical protein
MASSATSTVYTEVIEDVIDKVRDEFINNGGPGETVLSELQGVINIPYPFLSFSPYNVAVNLLGFFQISKPFFS